MSVEQYRALHTEEQKLRNRAIYKLTGRWPECVVAQRLALLEQRRIEIQREMDAWMKEMWLS